MADDVAAILSGIAVLAFLESWSAAAAPSQLQHQHNPPRSLSYRPGAAPRKLKPNASSVEFRELYEPPRHVFALPSSSLPDAPGLFEGSEIAARLRALQARQRLPNIAGKK